MFNNSPIEDPPATSVVTLVTLGLNYASIWIPAGHELAHIVDMVNEQQGARITDYPNPDEFHT